MAPGSCTSWVLRCSWSDSRHPSPSVGHSSCLDIWAAACSRRIAFLWGAGCFYHCPEPAPTLSTAQAVEMKQSLC